MRTSFEKDAVLVVLVAELAQWLHPEPEGFSSNSGYRTSIASYSIFWQLHLTNYWGKSLQEGNYPLKFSQAITSKILGFATSKYPKILAKIDATLKV